jgi:hypothetical protein
VTVVGLAAAVVLMRRKDRARLRSPGEPRRG